MCSNAGGGSGGGGISILNQLTDNTNFRAWVKDNLANSEFKQFGRINGMDAVKELWYQKRASEELKKIHEIPVEEAVNTIQSNIEASTMTGWFRAGDSDYKPRLVDQIMQNPGTLNAGLNVAYQNYKNNMQANGKTPQSFNKWVNTPQTFYRGERGQKNVKSDIFKAYTPNKEIAARFTVSDSGSASHVTVNSANRKLIKKIKVKPIDTWGSYQTTGEQEYLIPIRKVK